MGNELLSIDENDLKKLNPRMSIQEYLVDILGGLFPGILFILGLITALVPPLISLSLFEKKSNIFNFIIRFIESTRGTPSSIWFVLFLLFTLLAYVIGHIFYRRDIKEPDKHSFRILKKEIEKKLDNEIKERFVGDGKKINVNKQIREYKKGDEYSKELVQLLKENMACSSVEDCEFPYPYYSEYLKKRELNHLEDLACWCDGSIEKRSKTYINILKVRLRYFHPDKCNVVIKNEGHVRLASSAWYVSLILKRLSIAGIVVVIISLILNIWHQNTVYNFYNCLIIFLTYIPILMSPVTILYMSVYFLKNIGRFIHYQRLREIFYVLETTYTAFIVKNNKKLHPII